MTAQMFSRFPRCQSKFSFIRRSAHALPNLHQHQCNGVSQFPPKTPKHPLIRATKHPKTAKHPHNSLTHSYILCFVYIAGLCSQNNNRFYTGRAKALGKPCDVTGEMRAINESIREKWCYTKEKLVKGKQKYLNDTSAQLRKELAIWLLILERFAVS